VNTDLNGNFHAVDVPMGDYHVVAELPGYLAPQIAPQNSPEVRTSETRQPEAPSVRVLANVDSEVNVTIERGGTISGQVRYDDGAPVAGGWVHIEKLEERDPTSGRVLPIPELSRLAQIFASDDGRYRAAGLPPGRYRIGVLLQFGGVSKAYSYGNGSNGYESGNAGVEDFSVYAPDSVSRSKGKVYEIKAGEQVKGADIEIPLSKLHRVEGRAARREDGHSLFSGAIVLTDEDDKTFHRRGKLGPDGRWNIEFVPSGTYVLEVWGVLEDPGKGSQSLKDLKGTYAGTTKLVVLDDDVAVDTLLLDPAKLPGTK